MSKNYGVTGPSASGTSLKTALNLRSTAALRVGVNKVIVGPFLGPNATDFNFIAELLRSTAQGTSAASAPTPLAIDGGDIASLVVVEWTNSAEPTYTAGRARLPAIRGNIKFDHVTFRYRIDGQEVLHDVTFDVPAGQTVGIVGPSGSGKSTFAKRVQRLYVPESGRVLVDGVDLAMADPAWLRRQIGIVLQENVLFNVSVRENIALADPAMPMEQIIAAASLAGAHDFILELSEGYDTVVGERGSTLSGGQRQRIAIARALVTDPRILIFDEATSALDYESERIIQQNMREIAKGRTVLVIAHRLSTVRAMDRIVTLERGRLVEDGTHDALIRTGGRYASLHRLQAGIHEVN
jgi:subfamily B ATP-binding cassette protein HlyB/CyaB